MENFNAALQEGRILARGIMAPSAIRGKMTTHLETMASLELRKVKRRPEEKTRSGKSGKLGNPFGSLVCFVPGSTVLTSAGFFIINPEISKISRISKLNLGSGVGKKKDVIQTNQKFILTDIEKKNQIEDVIRNQKMGGLSKEGNTHSGFLTNSEFLYDVTDYCHLFFKR